MEVRGRETELDAEAAADTKMVKNNRDDIMVS